MLATLTTMPRPRNRMPGSASAMSRSGLTRSMSRRRPPAAHAVCTKLRISMIPAQLTRTSTGSPPTAASYAAGNRSGRARSHAWGTARAPSRRASASTPGPSSSINVSRARGATRAKERASAPPIAPAAPVTNRCLALRSASVTTHSAGVEGEPEDHDALATGPLQARGPEEQSLRYLPHLIVDGSNKAGVIGVVVIDVDGRLSVDGRQAAVRAEGKEAMPPAEPDAVDARPTHGVRRVEALARPREARALGEGAERSKHGAVSRAPDREH